MRKYPDISPLLKKKANRRQRLARRSFEEKIDIVNKWRELSRHIGRLRLQSLGTPSDNTETNKVSLINKHYLADAVANFRAYKKLAEKAVDQLQDEEYFTTLDKESNSIAVIMKHLAGNMLSRWTDFLTTDGEKPERDRDGEFVIEPQTSKADVMKYWEKGWQRAFQTLEALQPEDLLRTVMIRGETHTVVQAINRQLAHYPYHIGQIVFLAKHFRSSDWKSLSIPKNKSAGFNKYLEQTPGKAEHRFDAAAKFNDEARKDN